MAVLLATGIFSPPSSKDTSENMSLCDEKEQQFKVGDRIAGVISNQGPEVFQRFAVVTKLRKGGACSAREVDVDVEQIGEEEYDAYFEEDRRKREEEEEPSPARKAGLFDTKCSAAAMGYVFFRFTVHWDRPGKKAMCVTRTGYTDKKSWRWRDAGDSYICTEKWVSPNVLVTRVFHAQVYDREAKE